MNNKTVSLLSFHLMSSHGVVVKSAIIVQGAKQDFF